MNLIKEILSEEDLINFRIELNKSKNEYLLEAMKYKEEIIEDEINKLIIQKRKRVI